MWVLLSLLFSLIAEPASAVIHAVLENPTEQQGVSGIALLSGWAFSTVSGVPLTIKPRVNGAILPDTIACCNPRRDVTDVFGSGVPTNSGFAAAINYGSLPSGSHIVGVEITAPGESLVVLEHRVTVARPGDLEFLTAFSFAGANVAIDGEELIIAGARVGNGTATVRTNVRMKYAIASQSLIIGAAVNVNTALFNSVQEIFSNCLSSGCHGSENPQAGQVLSSGVSFQNIVAVRSSEVPDLLRINPGFPEKSYLLQKIEQEKPLIGGQMPLGGPPLSREQIEIIRQWISAGAPPPS